MMQHVIVWDGRRNGPGGALLFAEQHTQTYPAPSTPIAPLRPYCGNLGDVMVRFRVAAKSLTDWFTRHQVAELSGLEVLAVTRCISACLRRGELISEQPRRGGRRKHGELQRYRWVR